MEEKINQIEDIDALITSISVETGRKYNSVKNNWIYPTLRVPSKFVDQVEKIINKRLEYQKASKQLHEKYFGN